MFTVYILTCSSRKSTHVKNKVNAHSVLVAQPVQMQLNIIDPLTTLASTTVLFTQYSYRDLYILKYLKGRRTKNVYFEQDSKRC